LRDFEISSGNVSYPLLLTRFHNFEHDKHRNPMYLGHLIYLLGLTLTLRSWLGAVITIAVAFWFHRRVIGDEEKLATRLGKP
jgi:hypothetical protein